MIKIVLVGLFLVAALLVTTALVAGPSITSGVGSFQREGGGTEVRAEPARHATLIETVSAPGEIEPYTSVNISAVVSARIEELAVDEGSIVKAGDLLARLDDRDLQAFLLSAKARRDGEQFRLRSDQARLAGLDQNLEFAKRDLERVQSLFASGDVAERDLDQALERVRDLEASIRSTNLSISVVESSLAAANADVERATDSVANTVITAPIDGVVTQLNVEVGEIVTGSTTNPGTVVLTIADLSRMILIAQVAESDIAELKVDQSARLYINAYPDDEFRGTVRQIALQRSGNPDGTGYFRTEVEIDLRDRKIRSGLVANVDIEVATHEGIVVPYQSIGVRDVDDLPDELQDHPLVDPAKRKVPVVFRVVDGRTVMTPVRAGASDLTHRLVLEGLEPDAMVITGPFKILEELKHDEPVTVKTRGSAAGDGSAAETGETSDTE